MTRCTRCLRPCSAPRTTCQLVAALASVSHQMLALTDENARILLRLQLRILSAELDGCCQSCQWERSAQEHHDAGQAAALAIGMIAHPPTDEQIEDGKLGPDCKVLPLRRDLGVRFRPVSVPEKP